MKHIEKIFDVTTGEETFIERDYTAEEIKAMEELRKIAEAERVEAQVKAAAKQSAQDKLKALGLSDIEIAALVGA